jgi:hypothetical protein
MRGADITETLAEKKYTLGRVLIKSAEHYVRFIPESGHWQCKMECLLWAKSGHHHPIVVSAPKRRYPVILININALLLKLFMNLKLLLTSMAGHIENRTHHSVHRAVGRCAFRAGVAMCGYPRFVITS